MAQEDPELDGPGGEGRRADDEAPELDDALAAWHRRIATSLFNATWQLIDKPDRR